MHVPPTCTSPAPGRWRAGMGAPPCSGLDMEQGSVTTSHEQPGTSGTSPFQWDFISHRVLQAWRELLKPWGVLSPRTLQFLCTAAAERGSALLTASGPTTTGIPSRARGAGD